MEERVRIKRGIRWKLLILMIGIIVGLLVPLTFLQITFQKEMLEKELSRRIGLMKSNLIDQGKILSDNLARQTENGIAAFNFSNVTEELKKVVSEYKELSYIILMDSSGVAYAHTSRPELQQEKLMADDDIFAVKQNKAVIHEFSKDGKPLLEFVVPICISTEQWGVLRLGFSLDMLNEEVVNSKNEIQKKINDTIIRATITSVSFIAIGAGVVFFLLTRLSKPIINLIESARLLAKGNFSVAANLRVDTKDEIGILGASFTEMANNLRNSYEKLEDYSRNLEQKVDERTQELQNANKKLQELDKVKSDFLSAVSHELRTPLTSVLGFTKIIKKKLNEVVFPQINTGDKKTQRALMQVDDNISIIISEGERLTAMINDVLDLAKIEAGKIEWKMEPLAIAEIIEHATAATSALFLNKPGLKLITDVEDGLPQFPGDKHRLIQVLINLISNAVKFTRTGSITCIARKINNEIKVSVIDTGIGISEKDLDRIFEKFTQASDTLTDKPSGTGLGLPICKHIIEHHGGKVQVESEIGEGSTFSFTLPVSRKSSIIPLRTIDINSLIKQLKEFESTLDNAQTKDKKTILVVDDDSNIRTLLKQELETAGYNVKEAKDGLDAIAQAKKEIPDLITLDVMMPVINGFDVAAMLKNEPTTMNIPIIILSIIEDKERGYRIGVDRYLTKPIVIEELLKEVGQLISQEISRRKVLVIDEDESTVNTLTKILEARKYSVVGMSDDDNCMEKAKMVKPDMIIMDAVLSEKHKFVQTIRLEKEFENLHIVLLTRETQNQHAAEI